MKKTESSFIKLYWHESHDDLQQSAVSSSFQAFYFLSELQTALEVARDGRKRDSTYIPIRGVRQSSYLHDPLRGFIPKISSPFDWNVFNEKTKV